MELKESFLVLFADVILIAHVLFVLFVVLGLFLIYSGHFLKWDWVRNRTFRIIHLISIAIVVVQSWIGMICPLTTWEMALRQKAQMESYSGSFIQHWLHNLLYYNAPDWVFMVAYTLFGGLVIASWYLVPPNPRKR